MISDRLIAILIGITIGTVIAIAILIATAHAHPCDSLRPAISDPDKRDEAQKAYDDCMKAATQTGWSGTQAPSGQPQGQ